MGLAAIQTADAMMRTATVKAHVKIAENAARAYDAGDYDTAIIVADSCNQLLPTAAIVLPTLPIITIKQFER